MSRNSPDYEITLPCPDCGEPALIRFYYTKEYIWDTGYEYDFEYTDGYPKQSCKCHLMDNQLNDLLCQADESFDAATKIEGTWNTASGAAKK